jgi:hypothetical protein
MENKNDSSSKEEDDVGKTSDAKEKMVAKDLVTLKHVETKKQELSPETRDLAQTLKERFIEHDKFERLSNDEMTILESFMGKRLFIERIAIIANQSRIPLGIPGFKKVELEEILDNLIDKEYLDFQIVNDKKVYFLTERGKYRIQ